MNQYWFLVTVLFFVLVKGQQAVFEDDVSKVYEDMNSKSLNWGPYRSNLYVGVRPRIPDSILTGLLWFPATSFNGIQQSKHACDQAHNIEKFGWTKYDPRYGGFEEIVDLDCQLKLETEFVKSEDGLNWALRVRGKALDQDTVNSIAFYTGLQSDGKLVLVSDFVDGSNNLIDGEVTLEGYMEKIGGAFTIEVVDGEGNQYADGNNMDFDPGFNPKFTHHVSLNVPGDQVWKANEVFWTIVQMNVEEIEEREINPSEFSAAEVFQLRNPGGFKGTLHFIQKTFVGDFQFDVVFNVAKSHEKIRISSLHDKIKEVYQIIDKKFMKKFQFNSPFNTEKYIKFGKEILSQLLGGIIYQHGNQLVDRKAKVDDVHFSHAKLEGEEEGPFELFTFVPSRPFFPRGFYWDEGFHLLPILEYDSDLALEIVKSWFSLIDDDGWIAREQILGNEARSKVPEEFTIQNPNIANPPTLMMIFSELLDKAKKLHSEGFSNDDLVLNKDMLGDMHLEKPQLMIDYAEEIYGKLQLHYEWFRRTQRGESSNLDREYENNEEVYRWKGRTRDHCLPSGIDDYPRCDADIGELNVDLISWMGVMSRSMYKIAKLLGKFGDAKVYRKRYDSIVKNIENVHWSEEDKMFCDVNVDDDDIDVFECHEGYVSLMPLIHKLIPVDAVDKIKAVLEGLKDPEKLWSDYGIRSLSKKDLGFHKQEDYWRGHVWININYLVLESLEWYGKEVEDENVRETCKEMYKTLRENVVRNIANEYERTGYAWEQYNEGTGEGQRTKHFLGWTSLVLLMMKMPAEL